MKFLQETLSAKSGVLKEIRSVLVQKTGIILVMVVDAICAHYLGELGAFGMFAAVASLIAVVTAPWGNAAATEGALALGEDDRPLAARRFGVYAIDPLYISVIAIVMVFVLSGHMAVWLGESGDQASAYMFWALVAKLIGHVPMAGVKAMRKSGNTHEIIASTWILSLVNCLGNIVSIYLGWGIEGLAISWAVAEMAAAYIPIAAARRHELLAVPTFGDVKHVARKAIAGYIAAIPGTGVCALRTVVYATLSGDVLSAFIAIRQGYESANNLASQLAKVGVAANQRCEEGAQHAYKWSILVRGVSMPIAYYLGGMPAIVMTLFGHFALMAYCSVQSRADYVTNAKASGGADVVWACLIGLMLATDSCSLAWLLGARYAQQLTYAALAR